MTTQFIWRPLLIIGVCFWLSSSIQAQVSGATVAREGVVKGRVLDEKRAPVAKAEVYLRSQGLTLGDRYVETNAAGYFRMDHVVWGTYWFFAQKEDAGYPYQGFAFYNESRSPKVTLTPASPVKSVVVRVGPRCGKLAITITDAISGKAVNGAGIMLRRATDPRKYLGTNSPHPILIPSNADIEVEVEAKGYVSWPPKTAKSTEGTIRVKPGEVYSLAVRLKPSNP